MAAAYQSKALIMIDPTVLSDLVVYIVSRKCIPRVNYFYLRAPTFTGDRFFYLKQSVAMFSPYCRYILYLVMYIHFKEIDSSL